MKTQLAEKALQAAKAAEAALAGKQAVVEQLQQEVKEAEAVVAENTAAVHQQQGTVNAAIQLAQQATVQVISSRFLDSICIKFRFSVQINLIAYYIFVWMVKNIFFII